MAIPVPRFYDVTDTTIVTALTFASLVPSVPSAWQPLHLWNNKGGTGSEPIENGRVRVLAQVDSLSEFKADGLDVLDYRAVEVRLVGGSGVGPWTATGARGVGAGAVFDLPRIGNDEAAFLEVRINPPAGFEQPTAVRVALRVEWARYSPLAAGVFEAVGSLIRLGIGDGATSQVLAWGGVEPNGTPDDGIQFGDLVAEVAGVPFVLLAHEETLDGNDGNAEALDPGEGYVAMYWATANGLETAKGARAALPLTADDDPIPLDGLPLVRAVREEDGTIEVEDLQDLVTLGAFGYMGATGRVLTFGGGDAIIGPNRVRLTARDTITAPPSTTSTVWRMPQGGLEVEETTRPDPRALPLGLVTCDASDVTSFADLRTFEPQFSRDVLLTVPTPGAGDVSPAWFNASARSLFVRPLRGIVARLTEDPAAASGSWIADVEKSTDGGATWSSLFPSSGTDDRRPTIDFDGAEEVKVATYPEVLEIETGALLRAKASAVAAGGVPEALVVVVTVEAQR